MSLKEEFSPENHIDFDQVAKKSNKKFKWICSQGHHWEAVMANRTKGIGCPYCSGKRVLSGYNDLFTVRPDLIKEWAPENTVDPKTIGVGSGERVIWICSQGHHFESIVWNRVKGHECPYCKGKLPILGTNDLQTLFPAIAQEYDIELNLLPIEKVNQGSSKKAWWKCARGHSWQASIVNRTGRLDGCPYCSGRYPIVGETDLATTHPHLVEEWHPDNKKTPQQVSAGSEYKAKWQCLMNPQHIWFAIVASRTRGSNCPTCWNGVSTQEHEVVEFLKSVLPDGVEVQQSVRSVIPPKEIDIYIPSKNFAIEVNGVFWHTEQQGKDRNYHRNKYVACDDKGIQLFTIWQDDWKFKPEIVKRMLSHKLGVSQQEKIFARKTDVHLITKDEAQLFLEAHHIQGFVGGSYYLGLRSKDNGSLVAVMVLRKLKDDLYLDRYATSQLVVGGQGKLLKWVHGNLAFKDLITFADCEVSNGNLYDLTGWVRDKVLGADYKYVVGGKRVHKFNYRLKRFRNDPDLLWEEGLSESELAVLNGLIKVWDCGKIRYVMHKQYS